MISCRKKFYLPVISFKNFNMALNAVLDLEKPLAAYLFTNNTEERKTLHKNCLLEADVSMMCNAFKQ
jgi:hypothetical protein